MSQIGHLRTRVMPEKRFNFAAHVEKHGHQQSDWDLALLYVGKGGQNHVLKNQAARSKHNGIRKKTIYLGND